jgi:hypothetical protein
MVDDVGAKLDVLIRLQAAALIAQIKSSKDKIAFLHNAGLRPALIADLVGTTTNHVNVTISNIRKTLKARSEK